MPFFSMIKKIPPTITKKIQLKLSACPLFFAYYKYNLKIFDNFNLNIKSTIKIQDFRNISVIASTK